MSSIPSDHPPLELSVAHRRTLEVGSKIQPAVIAMRGYVTVRSVDELTRAICLQYGNGATVVSKQPGENAGDPNDQTLYLHYFRGGVSDRVTRKGSFDPHQLRLPALLLPLWWDGRIVAHRLRPDNPRSREGKDVKYEQPNKLPIHLDASPLMWPLITDPSVPLFVTEGEKKVDALAGYGQPTIGLTGVWCWQRDKKPLPEWNDVPLTGRAVVIAFDSDAVSNPNVARARDELTAFLRGRGAVVVWLNLPGETARFGVDDFIAQGWTPRQLVDNFTVRPQSTTTVTTSRLIVGGDFAFDEPDKVPAVWGEDENVLWSSGEGLMLTGHQGVGKTTLAQQLVLHRVGLRDDLLLGYPVAPSESLVLYLAMDRPRQAARSLRRMVSDADRKTLNARLMVWRGPLPFNLLREDPARLAGWVGEICAECRTIVVDSVKDLAAGIAKDEVGAALNMAWQEVIARDLELLLLHHDRKAPQDGQRRHTLDDVYGSTWLTAGLGSVLELAGEPGDPTLDLRHLKQPASPVGPLRVRHDHATGTTRAVAAVELLDLVVGAGDAGVTAEQAARTVVGRETSADLQRVRRELRALVGQGLARRVDGHHTAGGREPSRWVATGAATFARGRGAES